MSAFVILKIPNVYIDYLAFQKKLDEHIVKGPMKIQNSGFGLEISNHQVSNMVAQFCSAVFFSVLF